MASASGFKLICPSCEEPVPIRDESLIGKKVDCPTCKYRFVVEAPKGGVNGANGAKGKVAGKGGRISPEAMGDASRKGKRRRRDEDEVEEEKPTKKKKKDGSSNKTLLLGLGLGGVGLVVLAVAAILMLSAGGGGSKSGTVGQVPAGANNNVGDQQNAPGGGRPNDNNSGGGKQDGGNIVTASADFTNLLPRDTDHVFHLHMKELRNSPLGKSIFTAPTGINPAGIDNAKLQEAIGFSLKDIDQLLHGENYQYNWSFNALHSTVPFNEEDLANALNLEEPEGGPIHDQKYYKLAKRHPILEQLAQLTLAARQSARSTKGSAPAEMYVRLHDSNTLIIADRIPMQAFLQAKGKFEFHPDNLIKKEEPKNQGGRGSGIPGGFGPGGSGIPGPSGISPPTPGGRGQGGTGGASAPGIDSVSGSGGFQSNPNYQLTQYQPGGISPQPGQAGGLPRPGPPTGMDPQGNRVPAPGGFEPPVQGAPVFSNNTYMTLRPALKNMLDELADEKSASVKVLFLSATDMSQALLPNQNPMFEGRLVWRLRQVWDVTNILQEERRRFDILGTSLQLRDDNKYRFINGLLCSGDKDAKDLQKNLLDMAAPEVAGFFTRLMDHEVKIVRDEEPKTTPPASGPGTGVPGGFIPGAPSAPGLGTGGSDEDRYRRGGMSSPPGFPGGGGPPVGGFPGGGRFPGAGQQGGTRPPKKSEDDVKQSQIRVTNDKKKVDFKLDLVLTGPDAANLDRTLQLLIAGMRTRLSLGTDPAVRHTLAKALQELAKNGMTDQNVPPGSFPPGAIVRMRMGNLPHDPLERVSWMSGLLPYLGHEQLYNSIRFDKSWKEPANWFVARAIIPEFLDPTYPAQLQVVDYPGIPTQVGATHYVGLAGVGMNAADYKADDPAVAHKLGVFGYNRNTSLEAIQSGRGTANTAVMIQVPANSASGMTPWMAGGGSTVRGVPEKDSLKPFVGDYGGKRGAYVLMADGSVRFIAEGASDAAFQAIVTYKGPSPEGFDLEQVAPKVEANKRQAPPMKLQPTNGSNAGKAAPGIQILPVQDGNTPPAGDDKKKQN